MSTNIKGIHLNTERMRQRKDPYLLFGSSVDVILSHQRFYIN
jgi:hypothetical protein